MKNPNEPVPLTPEEKEKALARLIRRTRELALQYDKGDVDAVLDLANRVHTLVNPIKSESVLKKFLDVDVRTLTFASTPPNGLPFRLVDSIGRGVHHVGQEAGPIEASYLPRYDRGGLKLPFVPFDDWYTGEAVFELSGGRINRKDLIDAVRNRDGGAHLDTRVPPLHAVVMRQQEFRHSISDGKRSAAPEFGAQDASLRQIAFEVQLTIDKHLAKRLGIELSFPTPILHQLGSTFSVQPSLEYRKTLEKMAKEGDPNDPVTRFCARAAFYNDLEVSPLDMDELSGHPIGGPTPKPPVTNVVPFNVLNRKK